jgi:3-oxoacid CoA-transferase A subunit
MDKIMASLDEALADVGDGASVALGGFFTCGAPVYLTQALARRGARGLTLIVMSVGVGNEEVNELLAAGQVRKVVCNYPFFRSASRRSLFEELLREGRIECELYPMGTFVEKLRAGGAGLPAFFTPTGAGTLVAEGKEVRIFDGRPCLLETALRPDFALVHAWRADRVGNLVFRRTARNYNPELAMAGRTTIVEAEEVVEAGALDPDAVHLPGVFVSRVVEVERPVIKVGIDG